MKIPELLSPVGGKAHLKAAVNNGADAVYMGGMAFNARIFADNFSDEELPDIGTLAEVAAFRKDGINESMLLMMAANTPFDSTGLVLPFVGILSYVIIFLSPYAIPSFIITPI